MARKPGRSLKFDIRRILESFGAHVPNGRTGRASMKCPFHDDKTASASVDFSNNRFRCFSCDASGDGLDLLITQEGLSWDAAVARAEAICGAAVSEVQAASDQPEPLFGRPRAGGRR